MTRFFFASLALTLAAGCSCSTSVTTPDAGAAHDAPAFDALGLDTPPLADVGALDAPLPDTGDAVDGGALDGGVVDAGTLDAGTSADAAQPDSGTTVDAPTTGPRVVVSEAFAFGSCFPAELDPVIVTFTVEVSGATGSTATISSATLTLMGPSTITQSLTLDTTSIALTGGSGTAMVRKTGGTPRAIMGCGELCGGATWKLDLVFMVDGMTVPVTVRGDYECAF